MFKRCALIMATMILGCGLGTSAAAGGGAEFRPESFFDVFTELSVTTGQTLGVNLQAKPVDGSDPVSVAALHVIPAAPEDVFLLGEVPGEAAAPTTMHMFLKCPPDPSVDSFFDVFVDVEPPAGGGGQPVLAARPRIEPDPAMVDSFFDVFVDIEIPDLPPAQRVLRLRAHGTSAQGGVGLEDIRIGDEVNMADSFFDVFVEIEIGGSDLHPYDPALPAVVFDLSGRFRPSLDVLPGDADLDSDVDLDDFVILKTNFGQIHAAWTTGDFNTDGRVNLDDFVILKNNFGRTR